MICHLRPSASCPRFSVIAGNLLVVVLAWAVMLLPRPGMGSGDFDHGHSSGCEVHCQEALAFDECAQQEEARGDCSHSDNERPCSDHDSHVPGKCPCHSIPAASLPGRSRHTTPAPPVGFLRIGRDDQVLVDGPPPALDQPPKLLV